MDFKRNAIAMNISREMALDYGLIEPTPAEREKRDAELEAFRLRRVEANATLPEDLAALDAITEQPTRRVLDLHQRHGDGWSWRCEGCDPGAYAEDLPEWPCSTVEAIAEHYGITLPDYIMIERPKDGSLDAKGGSDG